jgi:hypothetical protein
MTLNTFNVLVIFLLPLVQSFFVPSYVYQKQPKANVFNAAVGDLTTNEPLSLDPALIRAASAKLPWEMLLQKEQEPILNLSRDLEAEISATMNDDNTTATDISWQDGSQWATTRKQLMKLWILPRDMSNGADERYAMAASKSEMKMLESVPQLLRLETVVVAAERVLALGLPPALLRREPQLLTYPADYIEGGLNFLITMMMSTKELVVPACRDTPKLLIGAVDGYIQEQFVQRALSDASEATLNTNKRIAANVANAYRAVKNIGTNE